jgi:hypothetical protein
MQTTFKNQAPEKENSATIQKRIVLSSISRKLRKIKETKIERAKSDAEAMYWESLRINDMLMMFLYNPRQDKEFKTFHQWKKEGKSVKKGEKAAIIWGQPIAAHKAKEKQEREQISQQEPNEDTYKLFPLCYLFANSQTV